MKLNTKRSNSKKSSGKTEIWIHEVGMEHQLDDVEQIASEDETKLAKEVFNKLEGKREWKITYQYKFTSINGTTK